MAIETALSYQRFQLLLLYQLLPRALNWQPHAPCTMLSRSVTNHHNIIAYDLDFVKSFAALLKAHIISLTASTYILAFNPLPGN